MKITNNNNNEYLPILITNITRAYRKGYSK